MTTPESITNSRRANRAHWNAQVRQAIDVLKSEWLSPARVNGHTARVLVIVKNKLICRRTFKHLDEDLKP